MGDCVTPARARSHCSSRQPVDWVSIDASCLTGGIVQPLRMSQACAPWHHARLLCVSGFAGVLSDRSFGGPKSQVALLGVSLAKMGVVGQSYMTAGYVSPLMVLVRRGVEADIALSASMPVAYHKAMRAVSGVGTCHNTNRARFACTNPKLWHNTKTNHVAASAALRQAASPGHSHRIQLCGCGQALAKQVILQSTATTPSD